MNKTFKILITLFLIISLLASFNFVFATSEDEEIVSTESLDDEEEVTEVIKEKASDQSSLDSTFSQSTSTKVSNINSYEQANLHLNNILCVILIAIGFLLILFAIALLIRINSLK